MFLTIPYRFPAWCALTLFSLISLLAILDERDGNWYFEAKWSLALASISFGIGALVCMVQLVHDVARDKFVATKVEGSCIILLVIVWTLAIPVIMSPSHGLAVMEGRIIDANLYFSSWSAFCSALFMFASYGQSMGRLDSIYTSRWWLCLFISSCITMTASIRQKNARSMCQGDSQREICQELRLGLVLSIASMAVSIGMVFLGVLMTSVPHFVGLIASLVVLAAWSTCVAYLTFDGPASTVGNLFFGTWISFLLALYLVSSHLFTTCSSIDSGSSSSTTSAVHPKTKSSKQKASKKDEPKDERAAESK